MFVSDSSTAAKTAIEESGTNMLYLGFGFLEWYESDDNAKSLPVLLYQEKLDTVSRKIATAAKTAIEESGTNMLYLVFGFLEWYESDDSQQPHLAPLVTMPVALERNGTKGQVLE